ncbi:uncharacterized protein [Dysidea avara]|uniref:uncharacterized protein n=1 Tax=Dysidea avara TaxID=196820 RepID=UPI00331D76A9
MDDSLPLPRSNTTSFFSTSTPRRYGREPLCTMSNPESQNVSSISDSSHLADSYEMDHSFSECGDVGESWTRQSWGPGELSNYSGTFSHQGQAIESSVCQLFQQIERSMESAFQELDRRMITIEKKVANIEERQQSSSGSHQSLYDGSSSSSGTRSCSGAGRCKRTPPDLQYKIRVLHSNFDETNQFHCHERIDGEHNNRIVSIMIKELHKDYPIQQIRDGCRTYKKTLQSKEKDKSIETMKKTRIRSRQQRIYDRRNKVVKNSRSSRIKKLWKHVTAEMMTEEESDDEGGFVRHRQSWRSDDFNKLMDHLDKGRKESLAKNRQEGEIVERAPPPKAKTWMITNAPQSLTTESSSGCGDNDYVEDGIESDV